MAKKSQTQEFVVRLEVPEVAGVRDVREYIQDAVEGWKRGYDRGDPLFSLDSSKVKVTFPRPKKTYLCSFTGRYIGGHAIIKAQSPQKAAKLLEKELARIELPQEVSAEDMQQVDNKEKVLIITDGDY